MTLMRRKAVQAAATAAAIQTLETRRFLSVTLGDDGVLTVSGTAAADEIYVGSGYDDHTLLVRVNQDFQTVGRAAVREIHVDCGDGDDAFEFYNYTSAIEVPVVVDGGAGNDILAAQDDRDYIDQPRPGPFDGMTATLLGGLGDDEIYAGVGADLVDGGAGNDTLFAFHPVGAPTLHGGDGADHLEALGHAILFGDAGDDQLTLVPDNVASFDGGNGDDSLFALDLETGDISPFQPEVPPTQDPAATTVAAPADPGAPATDPAPAIPPVPATFATTPIDATTTNDQPLWDVA